jgi:hypothetical protein
MAWRTPGDWDTLCAYCGSALKAHERSCPNCAGPRELVAKPRSEQIEVTTFKDHYARYISHGDSHTHADCFTDGHHQDSAGHIDVCHEDSYEDN